MRNSLGKSTYVVLNALPPNAPKVLADARAAVAVHDLEVAPVTLQQRVAFSHALTVSQTADEYEPNGKAAEEIAQLYQWLWEAMKKIA